MSTENPGESSGPHNEPEQSATVRKAYRPDAEAARLAPACVCNVASRVVWLRRKLEEMNDPALSAALKPFTDPLPFEKELLSGRMDAVDDAIKFLGSTVIALRPPFVEGRSSEVLQEIDRYFPSVQAMSDLLVSERIAEIRGDYEPKTRFWFYYFDGTYPVHLSSGWTSPDAAEAERERLAQRGWSCGSLKEEVTATLRPDYCNNLNEIKRAYDELSLEDRLTVAARLAIITAQHGCFADSLATARQRSEAYLLGRVYVPRRDSTSAQP